MNIIIRKWLDEDQEIQQDYRDPFRSRRVERIAELVYVNGGRLGVGGWGIIQSGGRGSVYGRLGLTQKEGFELMHISAMIQMLDMLDPLSARELFEEVKEIYKKKKLEWEKENGTVSENPAP